MRPYQAVETNKNVNFMTEDRFNFAPRVGVLYDVLKNHKLILRAAGGQMFIPPQPFFQYSSAFADPRLPFDATFTPSQVPAGFSTAYPISRTVVQNIEANPNLIPAGLSFGEFIAQYHHPDEYSEDWNANLQYQFTPDLYTQVAYVGLHDLHEISTSLPNTFEPGTCATTACATTACATGVRPYPALGVVDYNIFGGQTESDSMQLSLDYRRGGLAQADLYYTYGMQTQTWDSTDSLGNGASALQNPNDGNSAQGPSDGSLRNKIVGIFLLNAPTPEFARGHVASRETFGGWSIQGIASYNTGTPLNILANKDLVRDGYTSGTRPDHVTSTPFYTSGTSSTGYSMWLNPAAFDVNTPYNAQRYGNLGYNAARGPNSDNLDASVIKHFAVYKEQTVDFRFEMFNAFNHANMSNPNTTVGNPNFGLITTRSGPRNVQFAVRYSF